MSRRRPPWSSLGIDPTGEERAIKRAYAKKLKEIDVETEPAKFIALRGAMEDALRQAQWIGREDDPEHDFGAWDEEEAEGAVEVADGDADLAQEGASDDVGTGGDGDRIAAPVIPLPGRPNPWNDSRDRIGDRFAAIEAALRSQDSGREAVIDHEVRALWAEPALGTVDAAEDVEHRLAHMALNHGVAAAYLLRLASWHYGWARRAQQVGTGWPIAEVGRRAAAENWFQKVESGATDSAKSSLTDLQVPPTGNWLRDLARKRRIREFLRAMRQYYPEGEYRFDPDIVEAWERASDIRLPWATLAIGFGVALAMAGRTRQSPLTDPIFWAWWIGAASGLLLLTWLLTRRADRRQVRPTLDRWEAGAFGLLLLIPPIALLVPATLPATALLIVASALLFLECGGVPPDGRRAGFWLKLGSARYPLLAALLFVVHAMAEAPAGRMDWRQAVVPAVLAVLATHWARPRLVASWEAGPRWVLASARYALLAAAAGLLWTGARVLPAQPGELLVAAGFFVLLGQDAAADGYRRPLSTPFLIAYVLLLSGLAIMALPLSMALVVRRLADRLFIKA